MTAVLVIAGVDSSGGAGLLKDNLTLVELGVDSLCAVTAVTAQTDSGVLTVHHVPPYVISAQIEAALADDRVAAVKIGMLGTAATVKAVEGSLYARRSGVDIILDPVLRSTSCGVLLDADGRKAMLDRLFPLATLVTPNLVEAAALLDCEPACNEADAVAQSQRLLAYGPAAVLLKGGHGTGAAAVDYLVSGSGAVRRFTLPRINTSQRGTGCALASAIAAGMASGLALDTACYEAKKYVHGLFLSSERLQV